MPSFQHDEANEGQFAGTALPPPASPPPSIVVSRWPPVGWAVLPPSPPLAFLHLWLFPFPPFWFAVAPGGVFFPLPLSPPPPYFLVYTPA